jgi:hypothetical protein
MKLKVYSADKVLTFFVYCDITIKERTFDESFFKNIQNIERKELLTKYEDILIKNNWFTFLKDLALGNKTFEINEDILNLYKNFNEVDLSFWKNEYENFNSDEKFHVHLLDSILLQYFGFSIEEDLHVVLVPKNSCNELRMHSGVTNIREKNLIFIFVPKYKEGIPYKRVNLEVLLHEIIHLYIYRSDSYTKICELASAKFIEIADKNKIEGVCNELLARVFLNPNIFGLVRFVFNRNVLAENPLNDKLNLVANKILKEVLNNKIETMNTDFIDIFISNLDVLFVKSN